jgi:hypothetical protein
MKDVIPHYICLIAIKIRKTEYTGKVGKCSAAYQLNVQGAQIFLWSNQCIVPSIPVNRDIQAGCSRTEMIPVNRKVLL